MKYKCEKCHDTGSIDKSGDYLDCGHCDAAMQRKSMNDFLDKLPAMGDYDAAWLVHQRALAMAPKQEALAFDMVPRQLVKEAIADLYTRMQKSYAAEPERRITCMDINAVFMHVRRLEIGGCLDGAEEILAGMNARAALSGAKGD